MGNLDFGVDNSQEQEQVLWARCLSAKFNLDNKLANRVLLRLILYPKGESLGKLRQAIEDWERDTRMYETRTKNELIRVMEVTSVRPMRVLRGWTLSSSARPEILRFLEIHASREAAAGATPMDVDMLDAKYGHQARDCWGKEDGSSSVGSGPSNPEVKGQKNKDKQVHKSSPGDGRGFAGTCGIRASGSRGSNRHVVRVA